MHWPAPKRPPGARCRCLEGGSSGRLRREFGVLPPGDIRNCLAAVADDEDLLTRLFQYRFANGGGLSGHSFGNLLLTVSLIAAMISAATAYVAFVDQPAEAFAIDHIRPEPRNVRKIHIAQ